MKKSRFVRHIAALSLTLTMLLFTSVFYLSGDFLDYSINADARTIDVQPSGGGALRSVTLSPTTYVYDGTQKSPKPTVYGTDGRKLTSGTDYSYIGAFTTVGTWTTYVYGKGNYSGTLSAKWTITAANNPMSYTSSQSVTKTFSTSAQTATLAAASNAQGSVSYSISSQKNSADTAVSYFTLSGRTLTVGANTPVGTYTVVVKATAAGNTNYKSGSKNSTVTVTVNKANNTLTFTTPQTVTKTFSTSAQTAALTAAANAQGTVTYAINSQKNSADTAVSYFSLNGTTLTVAANTPAGTYTVVVRATAAGNGNYDSATKDSTVTVIVNQANIAPTVTMNGWAYGSTASNPSVSGNVGNGTVTYFYKVSTADDSTYTNEKPTEVGSYTVRAVIDPTENYNRAEATTNFTISKGIISPTVSLDGWIYGEEPNTPTLTGNTGNGVASYEYSEEGTDNFSSTIPTNAGTYTVRAIIPETEKYNGGCATVDFIIGKAEPLVTAPSAIENIIYSGEQQEFITAGSAEGGKMQYSLDGITYSDALPTGLEAGEYIVYYKVTGDSNHNDTTPATMDVTILPTQIEGNTKPSLVNFTLDGIIGANFYYPSDLDNRITKISFNIINNTTGNETKTINIDSTITTDVDGITYLKVTCPITVDKLYNGKITATALTDDTNTIGQSRTLNIDKYVMAIKNGNYGDKMKAVVDTMQQYSSFAQGYLNQNEQLSSLNCETEMNSAAQTHITSYENTDSVKYQGSQLILGTGVTIRLYFTEEPTITSENETYFNNQYSIKKGYNSNGYYVDIEDVPAFAVLHGFEFNYTDDTENPGKVIYYPIEYLNKIVNGSYQVFPSYTKNLALALYEYAVAVDEQFFPNHV